MLPTVNPKDGYLDLGFLTNTISGAIFGFLTPYGLSSLVQTIAPEIPIFANDFVSAWAMGLASTYIIEKLLGLQLAHKLATVLPTETRRAIKDFEKAIEEQRARNIPMPTVYPIEELLRVGYLPEQLLAEMRKGTALGKAQIRGRKHFYGAEFPSPEALMAALTIRPLGYPLIEAPKQIVIIVARASV